MVIGGVPPVNKNISTFHISVIHWRLYFALGHYRGLQEANALLTMYRMAAPKKAGKAKADRKSDRHKKGVKTIRLRPQFSPLVEKLAKQDASDATKFVNDLVREALKKAELWPPKDQSSN